MPHGLPPKDRMMWLMAHFTQLHLEQSLHGETDDHHPESDEEHDEKSPVLRRRRLSGGIDESKLRRGQSPGARRHGLSSPSSVVPPELSVRVFG